MRSPGSFFCIAWLTCFAKLTLLRSTLRIRSPVFKPARSAAECGITSATRTPSNSSLFSSSTTPITPPSRPIFRDVAPKTPILISERSGEAEMAHLDTMLRFLSENSTNGQSDRSFRISSKTRSHPSCLFRTLTGNERPSLVTKERAPIQSLALDTTKPRGSTRVPCARTLSFLISLTEDLIANSLIPENAFCT